MAAENGLTMRSATFGRSQKGNDSLKKNLKQDIERLKRNLKGDNYKAIKSLAARYWVGDDQKAFIDDLDKKINKIETDLNTLKTQIDNIFDNDLNNFKKNQVKNYRAK